MGNRAREEGMTEGTWRSPATEGQLGSDEASVSDIFPGLLRPAATCTYWPVDNQAPQSVSDSETLLLGRLLPSTAKQPNSSLY